MFNIINIRDNNIILEFPWLKTTEPLIFWAQPTVAFPEEPNRRIFFNIVIKERLLYFNTISSRELITHFQKKKPQAKVLWCKNN